MVVSFFPSLRAVILALFAVYLAVAVAASEHDILASYIVLALGTWLLFFGSLVFLTGHKLKKNFDVELLSCIPIDSFSSISNSILYADQNCRIGFKILGRQLFPFTRLKITVYFQELSHQSVDMVAFDSADLREEQHIDFRFPHRGVWVFTKAIWTIQDTLSFWQYRGQKNIQASTSSALTVYPKPASDTTKDSFYSSIREGDTSVDLQLLSGDNYDLKQYHPSDGLRKIVWKIFARTGQLLSRHPEKSMTPEGKVLLFVAGGRFGDRAYAECEAYMRSLLLGGMEVSASGATFSAVVIENNPDTFLRTSIETCFNPVSTEGLVALLAQAQEYETTTQVGIFIDISFSHGSLYAQESIMLTGQCIQILEAHAITPIFFGHVDQNTPKKSSAITSLLFESEVASEKVSAPPVTIEELKKLTGLLKRYNVQGTV